MRLVTSGIVTLVTLAVASAAGPVIGRASTAQAGFDVLITGGQIVDGFAERLVKTGAVVSGGTTTSTVRVAALPAASLHVIVKV